MIKRLKLTDDIISLISNFRFRKINDKMSGLDTYDLYGGTYLFEDMAFILGKFDQMIPGTETDPMGRQFPDELVKYFKELDDFIVENLTDLENIVHQFIKIGIKPGIYEAIDYEQVWKYKEEIVEKEIKKAK